MSKLTILTLKGLLVALCICKLNCKQRLIKELGYTCKFWTERACSLVNFEPACSSISNQRVRLSILNQCVLTSIDTFLKTSDQRIEQITITHLLIAQRIVLERQRCVIKTTDNSQLGQSGGRQYCLIAAFNTFIIIYYIHLLSYSSPRA